jgi:N-acyl homoserine lactone hydrolase
MDAFPEATVVLSAAERAAGPPRYHGNARPLAWPPDASCRLIDGDERLAPGLTLLFTPGHSPGHLSVLVELRETGAAVLACDAISRKAELEGGFNAGAWDDDVARDSARRLVELAREREALLVYGHDPAQAAQLRVAPDVYR